jgi:excisionase family DNA binding protein
MRLITASQLAEKWQLKPSRIYELARLKIIPSVRLGRQVRFDEAALLEWISRGGKTQPATERQAQEARKARKGVKNDDNEKDC